MTLSIIIPAYNEAATIDAVLEKVLAAVLPNGMDREVIVVDDGSTDGMSQAITAWAGHAQIKIIHQDNQGKASAIVTGLKQAGGDILLIQDADLEYDPAEYQHLLRPMHQLHVNLVAWLRAREPQIARRPGGLQQSHRRLEAQSRARPFIERHRGESCGVDGRLVECMERAADQPFELRQLR